MTIYEGTNINIDLGVKLEKKPDAGAVAFRALLAISRLKKTLRRKRKQKDEKLKTFNETQPHNGDMAAGDAAALMTDARSIHSSKRVEYLSLCANINRAVQTAKKLLCLRKDKFDEFTSKGVLPAMHALRLRDAALSIEPDITAVLIDLAEGLGGELAGLDFRFKSAESLTQKLVRDIREANLKLLEDLDRLRSDKASKFSIAKTRGDKMMRTKVQKSFKKQEHERLYNGQEQDIDVMEADIERDFNAVSAEIEAEEIALAAAVEEEFAIDIQQIAWDISDVLRYTMVLSTDVYSKGVWLALKKIKAFGAVPAKLKNYWSEGDAYQGINDVFFVPCALSPIGTLKIEVQFHTKESFSHKMVAHAIYEEFR